MVTFNKDELKEIALEIGGAMQQGRDKEVSSLFKEIKNDQKMIKEDVEFLKEKFVELDKKSVNYDNTTKIVYGLVAMIMTAAIGALLGLIFTSWTRPT